jgi:hypothetical protein
MTDEIDKFEGRLDILQDQYAALRLDVQRTIAVLQGMIQAEEAAAEEQ